MFKLLLGNPYVLLGIAAAVVASFLYARFLNARIDHWKEQHDQVQAILTVERTEHKLAMEAADAKRVRDLADATILSTKAREYLQDRVAHWNGAADALAQRLRDAERSRVRALAPANTAPAECGNYEADPTRLPEPARAFLIGEAAAAEKLGEFLATCRKDYHAVRVACGAPLLQTGEEPVQ